MPIDSKSKKIKKLILSQEQKLISTNKDQSKKIKSQIKVPKKQREILKIKTSTIQKYERMTGQIIQLDPELIMKAFHSLQKHFNCLEPKDKKDDHIYLKVKLKEQPQLEEVKPIQIYLDYSLYKQEYNSKIGFIVRDQEQFKEKLKGKLHINYVIFSPSEVKQNSSQLYICNLIMIDYTLWKKMLKYRKNSIQTCPFHTNNIPQQFRFQFGNNISYIEYLNKLISHSFTTLKNQFIQEIRVGKVIMDDYQIVENLKNCVPKFIGQILAQSKRNNVSSLFLKTKKSIDLLIFEREL